MAGKVNDQSERYVSDGMGISAPPEGAIVGENVPLENDQRDLDESKIHKAVGAMRSRGEPYIHMDESVLRELVIERGVGQ